MAISIQEFLSKFAGASKVKSGWIAKCPAHDDRKPSLSIDYGKDGGIVVFCQAHCETISVLEAVGCTFADIQPEQSKNGRRLNIVAEYDYRDEEGKLVYQAVRLEPKDFRQRRPDGAGSWLWNLTGVDRVLYRLPELIADESDGWVFIAEGEKDVDEGLRAVGLTATCNVGGAGKWRPEYNQYLRSRKVCILPDNDPPPARAEKKEGFAGQKHAVKIYQSLRGTAECVVILALPNLPIKGDVSDWLRAGGTRDELLKIADDLAKIPEADFASRISQYARLVADPDFDGDPAAALRGELPIPKDQIEIDYGLIKDLPTLTTAAWKGILDANKPPRYFRRGELLVRIEQDDDTIITRELTPDRMRHTLARVAMWREKGMDGRPPKDVVADVLATPSPALPRLNRIVEVPIFAPDGTLQTEPGYHPGAQVYYWPSRHLKCLPVPAIPTDYEVKQAVELIEELICDFPFAKPSKEDQPNSDKCHAIALFLLPFCRDMIDGPTPNHLIEASVPRSGKTLLAHTLLSVSIGENISLITESRDDDEFEKKITTALLENYGAILIDNVNRKLDSGRLAAALTARIWNGRILGRSASAKIPIKCVWVTTANNLNTTEEGAGRMIRIRIEPLSDAPERRSKYKHPKLKQWVIWKREWLIQAAHILIQNWIAKGKPEGKAKPLGSFEEWSAVIGGILETAKIDGFLENFESFYALSNQDKMIWREFCKAWYEKYPTIEITAAGLLDIAESIEGLEIRGDNLRNKAISLGRQLQKKDGAVYAGLRIMKDTVSGGNRYWKLKRIEEGAIDD